MKKIIYSLVALFVLVAVLPLSAMAKTSDTIPILVEDPDPFNLGFEAEREDPYKDLSELECLHKGLIRVYEGMSPDDLYSYMQVVDNSDDKFNTQKLFYILDMVLNTYYGALSPDELFNNFLAEIDYIDVNNMDETFYALMSTLDRFSYYLTAEEATSFFTPNDTRGAGISTVWKEAEGDYPAGMYVEMVAPSSPADNVGIKKGDRLLKINGIDITGLGFYGVSAILDANGGDADFIEYSFERYGEGAGIYDYNVERTYVTFPEYSVELYPDKKVLYIDIDSFMNGTTAGELGALIDYAWQEGYRDVILDLQNNSGGSVDLAAAIASKFTPQPLRVLFYMGREDNYKLYPYYSSGDGYAFDSVTVLVNERSASSSEILTDTLRKIAGAKVVGANTFGKGVAQLTTRFLDGTGIGVTAFVAYDAEGVTYNEKGIVPDVKKQPEVKKNFLGVNVENFTFLNYTYAVYGEENSSVSALEKRLLALQYISPAEVDGVFDDDTALAISALQASYGIESTGALDEETFDLIVALIKSWESGYTVTTTILDMVLENYR